MLKHLLSTLFLFFIFNDVAAQYSNCYYYKLHKAFSLMQIEQYEEANKILLEEQKKVDKTLPFHYLYLAQSSAGMDKTVAAIDYLEKAILGGYSWKLIQKHKAFKTLHETKEWQILKEKYPKLQKEYYATLDMSMYFEVVERFEEEQAIRRFSMHQMLKKDTVHIKVIDKYMERIDSLNMLALKEMTEEKGFPGWSKVGFKGNGYVFIMLLHGLRVNDWAWEFFEPVMRQAVREGEFMPFQYQRIVDDHHRCQNENQWYGVWECENRDCKTDYTTEEMNEIDKNRLELGLITLGEMREIDEARSKLGLKKMTGLRAGNSSHEVPNNYQPLDKTTISKLLNCNETND